MPRRFPRLLLALALAAPLVPAHATDDDLRTVSAMRNRQRVLIAFAPTLADPRLEQQRAEMAAFAAGAAERDLQFVQVSADHVIGARDDAAKLRRRFQVAPGDYRVLLLGKDGNVALTEAAPLDRQRLQGTIDAMPMRKAEVARARAGLGRTAP